MNDSPDKTTEDVQPTVNADPSQANSFGWLAMILLFAVAVVGLAFIFIFAIIKDSNRTAPPPPRMEVTQASVDGSNLSITYNVEGVSGQNYDLWVVFTTPKQNGYTVFQRLPQRLIDGYNFVDTIPLMRSTDDAVVQLYATTPDQTISLLGASFGDGASAGFKDIDTKFINTLARLYERQYPRF